MAAVKAIIFTKDIGLSFIILEGDLQLVINALKSEEDSFAAYDHLIEKAKLLAISFSVCQLSYTRCQANLAAHNIARPASHVSSFLVRMKDVPLHLNAVILVDMVISQFSL